MSVICVVVNLWHLLSLQQKKSLENKFVVHLMLTINNDTGFMTSMMCFFKKLIPKLFHCPGKLAQFVHVLNKNLNKESRVRFAFTTCSTGTTKV